MKKSERVWALLDLFAGIFLLGALIYAILVFINEVNSLPTAKQIISMREVKDLLGGLAIYFGISVGLAFASGVTITIAVRKLLQP